MVKRKDKIIDWRAVEKDYCDGKMAIREIGRWHGITAPAVLHQANEKGWKRAKPSHIECEQLAAKAKAEFAEMAPEDRVIDLAARMLDELNTVTSFHDELEKMICKDESDPRRRKALLRAISLGERSMTLKNINHVLKNIGDEAVEAEGKKAKRQAKAEKSASGGKFAVPNAPSSSVN